MTLELAGFGHVRSVSLAGTSVAAVASEQHAWNSEVVVLVNVHNQAGPLTRCLESIARQERPTGGLGVVVVDDDSSDDWAVTVGHFRKQLPLVVCSTRCGSPSRARNAALSLVAEAMRNARWVARLDADDCFSTVRSLASACALGDRRDARWVLGGNRLVREGRLLEQDNPATEELLRPAHVLSMLRSMAEGTAKNELPSCNLLLHPRAGWRYPEVESAEDHWLVTDLLLNQASSGAVLTAPSYCDYNLGGEVTAANRRSERYVASRQALFAQAQVWAARLDGGR
ncbi:MULTISPECIES: glycosyltransferase [Myxococcus]|uniref:Glycosyltransferase n=1 Tax=Myxococcus llanfairpwllgwyngyllgogerychwyrndrobwllllantysiliogogogochensis TaxID=2590453 RepID=A0A540X8E3_9BACT|nr:MULTISPECIES: glycosyltransferase [Myxococcus]NTX08790.1 glycosyltransferase [Myxococcus sp. CA040A]TQF17502.1 glycosyltransferase [Myxococcus llanfairpwllgwyngyllgogerychwyrndrobwllllantysiliogogogochensis]